MMGLIVKNFWKICKTPLILLHVARLKTWLTGVRPAVDLSWKALVYTYGTDSGNSAEYSLASEDNVSDHNIVP